MWNQNKSKVDKEYETKTFIFPSINTISLIYYTSGMLTSAMAHAFDLMKAVKPNMNTIQSQLQSQNNMIDCIRRGQDSYEDDD